MRPRAGRYIVICMRKVRAPQGRVPDNVRRRRLQGQCNRDIPPRLCAVRLERRGKSSPAYRVTDMPCKPHPVQDWNGSACGYAAEMAARHAPDNRVSATVTLRQDRWPHVGKPTDRTRLIACSFCFYKNTDGIWGGVRKTVKPTYGYDHRSVFMLCTGAAAPRAPLCKGSCQQS